eukprot:3383201-Ditylum_brightwellii.AAC.1
MMIQREVHMAVNIARDRNNIQTFGGRARQKYGGNHRRLRLQCLGFTMGRFRDPSLGLGSVVGPVDGFKQTGKPA